MNTKEAIIRRAYQDASTGLVSSEMMFRKLKSQNVTRKELQDFFEKQESNQLHKKPPTVRNYFPFVSQGVNDILQIDLADFSDISTTNDGYNYIITSVDVFSRYAYVYPIKNKSSETVCNVVKHFLNHVQGVKSIMSDNESEFNNRDYKYIIAQHDVNAMAQLVVFVLTVLHINTLCDFRR